MLLLNGDDVLLKGDDVLLKGDNVRCGCISSVLVSMLLFVFKAQVVGAFVKVADDFVDITKMS